MRLAMAEAVPGPERAVTALPEEEALRLARRAAGRRGLTWPDVASAGHGVGGFTLDMTHHPGPETVVWATLGKQDGVLALFAGPKLLATADSSLGEVLRVQPVDLPGLPHSALMVDDRVDQMAGAFYREERRRIYVWDGHGLRQVFTAPLLREQVRHARWENPRARAAWLLDRTVGDVALTDGFLTETLRQERLEAPGTQRDPVPPPGAFRRLEQQTEVKRYRWNNRLRRFDPA
ncbi:MAG TPA: hypothetical protein VGK74_22845 [Symbiobacteriaceae bacterium]|jgi:hypothetical protein